MPPGNLEDWVALHLLPGLGPILLRRCLDRFGDDPGEIAYRVPASAFHEIQGAGPKLAGLIASARSGLRSRVEREMRASAKLGIRLVPLGDPGYPVALETLSDCPALLYLKGSLPEGVVRLAVVGSRRATAYGRRVAVGLASGLAERGIEVVSGGARGI